jgi:hypothetical protein
MLADIFTKSVTPGKFKELVSKILAQVGGESG